MDHDFVTLEPGIGPSGAKNIGIVMDHSDFHAEDTPGVERSHMHEKTAVYASKRVRTTDRVWHPAGKSRMV
ncbi:MAG: hypothetical protein FJZ47_19360 [Candidatus Tectomicrobia bacterium]|uniref:Uncharacterized protein n=1 Tax=Tectimicrobiota bacterium TaxID=2528274 RepID=A0A937W582_UNCTE|nr:hypothetical protein [Candidatus Tectomicrobia bacterium]